MEGVREAYFTEYRSNADPSDLVMKKRPARKSDEERASGEEGGKDPREGKTATGAR